MLITTNTFCDDTPMLIDEFEEEHYYFGSGWSCCDKCLSIIDSRLSWGEIYNV